MNIDSTETEPLQSISYPYSSVEPELLLSFNSLDSPYTVYLHCPAFVSHDIR